MKEVGHISMEWASAILPLCMVYGHYGLSGHWQNSSLASIFHVLFYNDSYNITLKLVHKNFDMDSFSYFQIRLYNVYLFF